MLVSGIGMFKTEQNRQFESKGNNIGMQSSQIMNEGYGKVDSFEKESNLNEVKQNDSCSIIEKVINLIKGA